MLVYLATKDKVVMKWITRINSCFKCIQIVLPKIFSLLCAYNRQKV